MFKYDKNRLELALEAAKAGTWILDLKTQEIDFDDFMYKILETDPDSFLPTNLDDLIAAVIYNGDKVRVKEEIQKAIDEIGEFDMDCRMRAAKGGIKYLHCKGRIIFDKKGNPDCLVGICLDFTDRKKSQNEFNRYFNSEISKIKEKTKELLKEY